MRFLSKFIKASCPRGLRDISAKDVIERSNRSDASTIPEIVPDPIPKMT